MNDSDRRAVMAAGAATSFKSGQLFFDVGDTIDKVHFLVSGAVSTTLPMRDGSAVEVMLIGSEGAVGLLCAYGPIEAFGRVRAETDGAAITLPVQNFTKLIHDRPTLRQMIGVRSAVVAAELARGAACNAVHKLEPRLAKSLLRFHDRVAGDELALTQEHMSRMLGVSRTTLNAVAQALQEKGAVRYSRGRMGILDRGRLEALSCECYRPVGGFKEG
jgi:CRP-like cAMP-binding protein